MTLFKTIHFIIPCILNNLITVWILHRFIKAFLGGRPELQKTSAALYLGFFIVEIFLNFQYELSIVPYYMEKYYDFALYLILFAIIMALAFCYKPSLSAGFYSAVITALALFLSIPVADFIFNALYQFIVPNFTVFHSTEKFRHIFYIIFEENQYIFICVLEIMTKLIFLLILLRIRHIYDERNMYYTQAVRQEKTNLELKQFRHDVKNHMGALNQMLAASDADKAIAYLSAMNDFTDTSRIFSSTGNVALDSIINYKLSEAEKNDISCTLHAAIPEHLNVDDKDIIIILGNLLDNAMEACMKLEKNRYIHMQLGYNCGILMISVRNSYNGSIKKGSGNTPATSKKDKSLHGIGLANIKNALNRCHGTLEITADASEFCASAMMYVKML